VGAVTPRDVPPPLARRLAVLDQSAEELAASVPPYVARYRRALVESGIPEDEVPALLLQLHAALIALTFPSAAARPGGPAG
jgi:hypothetical protein